MSFILDALRKSDQQRRQGAAPSLLTFEPGQGAMRRKSIPWLGLLAAVTFVAGVAIGGLKPWQAENPAVAVSAPAETVGVLQDQTLGQDAAVARQPLLASESALPQQPEVPQKAMVAEIGQPIPAMPSAAVVPIKSIPDNAEPKATVMVVKKDDLPAEILSGLPSMSVALHAYSAKSENRMVIVNGKTLQEGEALSPGLILEQITPEDMVFAFRGYRFRQGVQ